MERWIGKVALVTGASSGIGRSIAKALTIAGMKVVGAARVMEAMQAIASDLAEAKGSFTPIKCDLSKDEDIYELFYKIKEKHGGVDVCINNAGLAHPCGILDGQESEWRNMLDINVVALCICARETVKSLKERNADDGYIINLNSLSGHRLPLSKNVFFYSATKYAVTALTEGLRRELRETNSHIRVSQVSPGVVETDFFTRMMGSKEAGEKFYASLECLQPEDISNEVVHLLSTPNYVQIHDVLIRPVEQSF